MKPKLVIFLPFWVRDALYRNDLRLEDILRLDKIRSVMSINDLACLMRLQDELDPIVGCKISPNTALFDAWYVRANEENRQWLLNTAGPYASNQTIFQELAARLFMKESANPARFGVPFEAVDISRDVAAIIINPGFFTDQAINAEIHIQVIEAILKLLYMYQPYNEVCATEWGKQYLKLLSHKRLAD